jgi:hypothetical protein
MDILIQDFLEAVRERKNNNKMSQGREWRDRRHRMYLVNLIKRGNLKRLRSIIGTKKALGTVLRIAQRRKERKLESSPGILWVMMRLEIQAMILRMIDGLSRSMRSQWGPHCIWKFHCSAHQGDLIRHDMFCSFHYCIVVITNNNGVWCSHFVMPFETCIKL